jgi:hypothetical protein
MKKESVLLSIVCFVALAQRPANPPLTLTTILGRPTDRSIAVSVLSPTDLDAHIEYGTTPGRYTAKTQTSRIEARKRFEITLERLQPDTQYYYRFVAGEPEPECTFHTQRAPGRTFTFGVQGDSHPERLNRMYTPDLYLRTLQNVRRDRPDFYILLGDDFNVDPLYNRDNLNARSVAQLYVNQRQFLGTIASSTALFLVNGNHEQAAAIHLNGTPDNVAIFAGKARNTYFPLPAPDPFYTGDAEPVEHLGLRRDYYSWTWGDALFVTIDPYWHSPVQIDEGIGGQRGERKDGRRNRDLWAITMGDAQYHWLEKTLAQSKARYKFVFTHHVSGTGRGGVEVSDLGEWGGKNRAGEWEFDKRRPGWSMPVHQLMAKYGVTVFFQGHDHLFAHQQRDGVVYQETPNPADNTYTAFNREAYRTGDVLPNSGYLRVTVSPSDVKVDYIRSWMAADETASRKNGETAFSYTVPARKESK